MLELIIGGIFLAGIAIASSNSKKAKYKLTYIKGIADKIETYQIKKDALQALTRAKKIDKHAYLEEWDDKKNKYL